jgi:hypothetical protein
LSPAADHDSETAPSFATAVTEEGAVGPANGTTVTTELAAPTPDAFRALTRNDTVTPLLRPDALYVVAVVAVSDTTTLQVAPPSIDFSIWYPVTALPPLKEGASHESDAVVLAGVAVRFRGADGPAYGVPEADADGRPVPDPFTAATRK